MNIDAQRIRTERERRAWTQAQLAGATGLGLRTVQRIEREGSASFESAQAIAAALELTIAELRNESAPKPDLRTPGFPFLRLIFAALSGAAVWLWLDWRDGPHLLDEGPFWAAVLDYLVPGGLFAAAVLIPELPASRSFVRRALGLVLASAMSFFTAVMIAIEGVEWLGLPGGSGWGPSIYSSLLASIVGAAIVLAGAHSLIGADRAFRLWVAGMIAALLGGVVMHGGLSVSISSLEIASFAIWHVLLCAAIRVGRGMEIPIPTLRPLIRSARAVLPGGRLWRLRAPQT
jgi:transcriptional regulator with XRE-family HTH domain